VGPVRTGNSQALAGKVGKAKVLALGDNNGFLAMQFKIEEGGREPVGINVKGYDGTIFFEQPALAE
jgi:hypothetical protein